MDKIELMPGIFSSRIGFGCAPILGSVDAKSSRRALECALECGINHFDLARSYGYGEAERFVAGVIRNQRQNMVIASKFGIEANWKAQILKPVKPIMRALLKKVKKSSDEAAIQTVPNTKTVADHFHNRKIISGKEMRKSLEKSLRELNTDYLDYFFIHEPHESILDIDDVLKIADILKTEGKIRGFGLAFMRTQRSLHNTYLDKFDILQFDNSPGAAGYEEIRQQRNDKPNILFSPLRSGDRTLSAENKLRKLFDDFPKSVVLCSMFNEKHLKSNVALVS